MMTYSVWKLPVVDVRTQEPVDSGKFFRDNSGKFFRDRAVSLLSEILRFVHFVED